MLLLTLIQAANAQVKWTAQGQVDSLSAQAFQAELDAAAAVWTVDIPECGGQTPLLAWTDDRDQAEVVIETVSDPDYQWVANSSGCSDPEQPCLIELVQEAPWALPAQAVAAECQDLLPLRRMVAHSMGYGLGAQSFGEGETYLDDEYTALMYFSLWCDEVVALTSHDLALLDLYSQPPRIDGVENGGGLWLAAGEVVELTVGGPEIAEVLWSVDGASIGQGTSMAFGPIQSNTVVHAQVTYTHRFCERAVHDLSFNLLLDNERPSNPGSSTIPETAGCSTVSTRIHRDWLPWVGVLLLGLAVGRRRSEWS